MFDPSSYYRANIHELAGNEAGLLQPQINLKVMYIFLNSVFIDLFLSFSYGKVKVAMVYNVE